VIVAVWNIILFFMAAHCEGISALEDLSLDGGFRLSAIRSSMNPLEIGRVLVKDESLPSLWRLCQWGSNFSLEGAEPTKRADGSIVLANEAKEIVLFPGGLSGEGVCLTVRGGVEYGDRLRQKNEQWAHLLVEQSLRDLSMKDLRALHFSLDFQVIRCVADTDETMDPGLHTAQTSAYWNIHNNNPQSEDYRDMIWFGVPIYDVRYPIPPGHQAVDQGNEDSTGKFICTMEGSRFYDSPVEIRQWYTVDCDLVPLLKEALDAAQSRGFLVKTCAEDLSFGGFNLGWEVPGSYTCSIHFKNLKLEKQSCNK